MSEHSRLDYILSAVENDADYPMSIQIAKAELSALRSRVAELEAARNVAGVLDGVSLSDWLREELSSAADCRERVDELEAAQSATLTPRPCVTCQQAAEKMRDAAANRADEMQRPYTALEIRALPLPTCGDCNPLAPSKPQSQAALSDQLRELVQLANANGLYDAADYIRRED